MDIPDTRASLLARLDDPRDDDAWRQFVSLYGPVVFGFATKRGLQDSDAADLTQDVLRAVATAVHRLDYDPRKGLFRSWLYTVARNKLQDFAAVRNRQCQGSGDTGIEELLAQQPAKEDHVLWDKEYDQQMFLWASTQVRGGFAESSWQAFWQVAVEGRSPEAVAEALGMSLGAVYIAKSRILKRLRQEIQQFLGE
jgi:RNA polymerase sigma factor (sigma-70 family)